MLPCAEALEDKKQQRLRGVWVLQRPGFVGVQVCWQPGERAWPAALRRDYPTSPQWDWRKEKDTSRQALVEGWGRESSSQEGGCGNRDHNIVRAEIMFAAGF